MAKEIVNVGIANEGEISLDVEIVKTWTPKDVNYFGETVFFKHDSTYYSMKYADFKRIFNK